MKSWLVTWGCSCAMVCVGLFTLLVAPPLPAQTPNQIKPRCLFATTVGDERTPVGLCITPDPQRLADNPDVRKLIAAINVPPELVSFRGCPDDVYAVHLAAAGGFIVTYPPKENDRFLAPIAHELSHVMQIRAAGGLDQLIERYESRRIELGADYIAGILFRRVLSNLGKNEFQNHVRLKGLYREGSDRAHGTPVQRTNAFRLGVVGLTEPSGITLPDASDHFQDDIYAVLVSFD